MGQGADVAEGELMESTERGGSPRAVMERTLSDPDRLAAVLRTELLDSAEEEVFDRMTRLAARLTGAPVSFISVLDEGRDYYKSCFGFEEPLASGRELTGRTFCHYAAVSDQPLIIPDTRADEVYRGVPTVETLGIAAYLGIPLKTSDGQVIGSFCAVDFEPREWSADDVEILVELAGSALREVELRAAMKEAGRLTESRARLVRGFSHDLKNPLGAASGHAELLEDGLLGDLTPRQRESVGRIRHLLATALELIDDVVELARAEAGEVQLQEEEVDLRGLASELMDEYRAQVEAAGLGLSAELPADLLVVRSDPRRIRQIMGNLVANAIKYNREGGRVALRLEPRTRSVGAGAATAWVAVDVEDTGVGIPPEQHHLLFREFTRLAPETTDGSGLGLAISRRVARALGGEITFESAPGRGTTFTFWMPIRGPAAESSFP